MKTISLIIFSLSLLLVCVSPAEAHAFLDHADPKVGGTLTSSPSSVNIWFTEELEGAFSTIKVFNAGGEEVDRKDARVDSGNKSRMTVSVPQLGNGTYRVEWSAVSVDTHHTTGTFTFDVKNP